MAEYVIMPKLGFNMDKGTLVRWVKKEGDFVKEQEVIFEVETDKTVIEVETQTSGILRKILVKEGETIPVTLPIAIIGDKDEDVSKMIEGVYQRLQKTDVSVKDKVNKEASPIKEKSQKIEPKKEEFKKISPRARRKAKELGLKVQLLKGSGSRGAVLEKDVISYYQNYKVKMGPGARKGAKKTGINLETVKSVVTSERVMKKDVKEILTKTIGVNRGEERILYTGMRKIIGDRLSQSKFTAPHIYFTTSVDMSKSIKSLKKYNQNIEKKISVNDFLVFILARVLSEQPNINCSLVGEEIVYHNNTNIGVAVAIKEGLIVPVVKNTNKKSLSILSKEIRKLIKLAREKKLMPDDYKGGTFTISNLGMYGIENFTAIINPPEAAILAVGEIKRMPAVVNDDKVIERIEIRSLMKVTLSVDHRLIDGVMAVSFLKKVKYYLEFPDIFTTGIINEKFIEN